MRSAPERLKRFPGFEFRPESRRNRAASAYLSVVEQAHGGSGPLDVIPQGGQQLFTVHLPLSGYSGDGATTLLISQVVLLHQVYKDLIRI